MARVCPLLGLPGELRNIIYDCILVNEGICVTGGRTSVHPLGRTCRQLHREFTSRTIIRVTDASLQVTGTIFDFDFAPIARWLEANPHMSGAVRRLALNVRILSSTSEIGLPYEGEDVDGLPYSLRPVSNRRLTKLRRNLQTWNIGKWESSDFDVSFVRSYYGEAPRMKPSLSFFHLHTETTVSSYVGTLGVHMEETTRYSPSWPKPRNEHVKRYMKRFAPADGCHGSAATRDYAHRIRHLMRDIWNRNPISCAFLGRAMHDYLRSPEYNRLAPSIGSKQDHDVQPSMHADWWRADEESYRAYDANVLRAVTSRALMYGHDASQYRALKSKRYPLGCKREAVDDQCGPRKLRRLGFSDFTGQERACEGVDDEDGTLGWDTERMTEAFARLSLG